MFTLGRRAFRQGSDKLCLGPSANAVLGIGGDIGDVKRSKRRNEAEPATEPRAVLLLGHCVAGRAAAYQEHFLAVGKIRRMRTERANRYRLRNSYNPESCQAKHSNTGHPQ